MQLIDIFSVTSSATKLAYFLINSMQEPEVAVTQDFFDTIHGLGSFKKAITELEKHNVDYNLINNIAILESNSKNLCGIIEICIESFSIDNDIPIQFLAQNLECVISDILNDPVTDQALERLATTPQLSSRRAAILMLMEVVRDETSISQLVDDLERIENEVLMMKQKELAAAIDRVLTSAKIKKIEQDQTPPSAF